MKNAIIVHGMPSREGYEKDGRKAANKHWLPWLVDELAKKGIEAHAPEMPEPYAPDYEKWKKVFDQFNITEDTALIGHSCGGGFLVRWLSENKVRVEKVALIAPWMNPDHSNETQMFEGVEIDEDMASRTQALVEFISLDDHQEELDTLKILKSKIKGLQVKEFTDRGHFTFDGVQNNEFPELLEFLIQ